MSSSTKVAFELLLTNTEGFVDAVKLFQKLVRAPHLASNFSKNKRESQAKRLTFPKTSFTAKPSV